MNVNWNAAASATQWVNFQPQHKNAETTGAIAKNNDPIFKQKNAETTGAIAMFDSAAGAQQNGGFMAVA